MALLSTRSKGAKWVCVVSTCSINQWCCCVFVVINTKLALFQGNDDNETLQGINSKEFIRLASMTLSQNLSFKISFGIVNSPIILDLCFLNLSLYFKTTIRPSLWISAFAISPACNLNVKLCRFTWRRSWKSVTHIRRIVSCWRTHAN